MNVKKTKSSKKIVLKITMSMTPSADVNQLHSPQLLAMQWGSYKLLWCVTSYSTVSPSSLLSTPWRAQGNAEMLVAVIAPRSWVRRMSGPLFP